MNGADGTTHAAPRGAGGYIMVMALLILAIVFVLGLAFLALMGGETRMVSSDRDMTLALNAADAGVQQAVSTLKAAASITTALQTPWLSSPPQTTLPGGAAYTFTITNDPAEAGSTTDANNLALITSTGTMRDATRIIETVVFVPKLPAFPAAI